MSSRMPNAIARSSHILQQVARLRVRVVIRRDERRSLASRDDGQHVGCQRIGLAQINGLGDALVVDSRDIAARTVRSTSSGCVVLGTKAPPSLSAVLRRLRVGQVDSDEVIGVGRRAATLTAGASSRLINRSGSSAASSSWPLRSRVQALVTVRGTMGSSCSINGAPCQ